MEGFVVSARKYRPSTFDSVVGQSHVTHTLRNALKREQLAHAYLFCGPRGVGKTSCARILAKGVNCNNLSPEGDPCNKCDSCRDFNEGRSLNIFELDAASNNSVDDIRNLIEQLRYIPQAGRRNVYIIDEVHMLSTAAFNAFLKTLEEPPAHALFILATTEKHKILPTILSRCQKFDFKRIGVSDVAKHLAHIAKQEGIAFEEDALQLIAQKADGAMRDALSIFDQIVNFSDQKIDFALVQQNLHVLDYDTYFQLMDAMQQQSHSAALLVLDEVLDRGFDGYHFLSGLVEHFRNLLVAQEPSTLKLLELPDKAAKQYAEAAARLEPSLLLNAFNLTSEAERNYRQAVNPRLHIELCLVKLCHLGQAIALAQGSPMATAQPLPEKKSA